MGARQSVAQPTRQRMQPTTTLNGHTNGPSTSAESSEMQTNPPRQMYTTRETRELRTRSLMIPDGLRTEGDGSPSISNGETGLVMVSSTSAASTNVGVPTLDRLLRIGSLDVPSTTRTSNRAVYLRPFHFRLFDVKCPVCHKIVPSDDVELHLVVCLTKPRLNYNEDVLIDDKGECVICFDEMVHGDIIARLPCLCIYHKTCIDSWFRIKNSCPEHPGDE